MNDDFLYRIRPPVRKEFAQELNRRLLKQHQTHRLSRNWMVPGKVQWSWGMALLSVLLILFLLFTFSSDVRANVVNWIQTIAGFQVEHLSVSPNLGPGEASSLPGTKDPVLSNMPEFASKPTATVEEPKPTIFSVPTLSTETLLENAPFEFGLPHYIPDGFALNDSAAFANSTDWALLTWSKTNAEITMLVERTYTGYYLPVGPGSTEEVQVNAQPALIIRGWWDQDHNWDPTRKLELHWQHNERYYRLIYTQRSTTRWEIEPISTDIPTIIEDLIKMAESIP